MRRGHTGQRTALERQRVRLLRLAAALKLQRCEQARLRKERGR